MDEGRQTQAFPDDPERLPAKRDERQKRRRVAVLVIVFLLASVVFGVGLWWLLRKREGRSVGGSSSHHSGGSASPLKLNDKPAAEEQSPQPFSSGIRISVSEPEDVRLSPSLPAVCTFFPTCFPSGYKDASDQDMQRCQSNMYWGLQSYYTAIATDGASGKVVGIMQVKPIRGSPKVAALVIYNVCVHPEHRRQGIASRLFTDALPRIVDLEHQAYCHSSSKRDPERCKNLPTVLALDVFWKDEHSAGAFALYAKLGFTDHLQPVGNIEKFPFEKVASGELSDSSLLEKAADAVGEATLKVPADGRVGSCFAMFRVVDAKKPPLMQPFAGKAADIGKVLRNLFLELEKKGVAIAPHA